MFSSHLARSASCFAVVACAGCLSARVFDYRGAAPAPTTVDTLDVVVAVNDLALPNVQTEIVRTNAGPGANYGEVRFAAMEERLAALLSESRMVREVRLARDLSRSTAPASGYVVQYSVQSYSSDSSLDAGGVFAGIMGTILTGGLTGGLLIFTATERHEHHFEVEVRLYRVEDSQLVSAPAARTSERIAQYDTAGAELVWRTREQLTIRSGHCQMCVPGGADAERFHREEGAQMATVLFEETGPELNAQIRRAMRSAAAFTRESEVPRSEVVPDDFSRVVRSRLDERSSRILLCTATDAAVLVAEWSGAGPVNVDVEGATGEVSECVRAVVGDLAAPSAVSAGRVRHVVSR
jgi:hypothetical protein